MASGSIISAVEAFIPTLTAANFPNSIIPPIWLDEAPQEGPTGSQLRAPYLIIKDDGGKPKWTFGTNGGTPGQNAISEGRFTLEAYYLSLADCDQAMNAILWNGATPNDRLGLAFATLALESPYKCLAIKPELDQRRYSGFQDLNGKRVHMARQDFSTQVAIGGSGY